MKDLAFFHFNFVNFVAFQSTGCEFLIKIL